MCQHCQEKRAKHSAKRVEKRPEWNSATGSKDQPFPRNKYEREDFGDMTLLCEGRVPEFRLPAENAATFVIPAVEPLPHHDLHSVAALSPRVQPIRKKKSPIQIQRSRARERRYDPHHGNE